MNIPTWDFKVQGPTPASHRTADEVEHLRIGLEIRFLDKPVFEDFLAHHSFEQRLVQRREPFEMEGGR
jgi:hypothetical protein